MTGPVYFTEHLIVEILSHLPVKILLRFRCVSKQWCSLIDSPRFVKTHLKRSIERNTNTNLIVWGFISYTVDFDSLDNTAAIEINQPLKSLLYASTFVGSCNGLHCLLTPRSGMVLWDPATRKYKKLTLAPTDLLPPFKYAQTSLYGFGYDNVNDDYKFLGIFQPGHAVAGCKVLVHGLKNNSWKQLQYISSHFQITGACGMFLGGALHWIAIKTADSESCPTILAVDVGVEKYREVLMPKVQNKNVNDMAISIFDKSLCIVEHHPCVRIDVWVMNDYGVGSSWCKVFSVEQQKVIRSCSFLIPIAYSKNRGDVYKWTRR